MIPELGKILDLAETQEKAMQTRMNRVMMHINVQIDKETSMQFVFNIWDETASLNQNMIRALELIETWKKIHKEHKENVDR